MDRGFVLCKSVNDLKEYSPEINKTANVLYPEQEH